ncbi:MAG: reverse transcriptase domain-containing protein, partial [Alphaproteobacteria bacterium]|nr:reverse transcriptase domain-containing protein [Alphaproteobacteria bacterium]
NEETSVRMAVGSIQLSDLPTNNVEESSSTGDESTCPLPLPEPFDLPQYDPAEAPNFVWGSLKGEQFCRKIDDCYDEMVTWKRNIFKVPSGKQGQAFVRELARLFSSFAEANSMERITLKAAMVLPPLILQKPSSQSKAKDHAHCIERRMKLWLEGELDKLLEEVRAIQSRLPVTRTDAKKSTSTARRFAELMMEGKVHAATRLLDNSGEARSGEPLGLDEVIDTPNGSCTVREALLQKHPTAQPCEPSTLLPSTSETVPFHPVIFDAINASSICAAALKTKGSHGPSGLDATAWRRMCCSFKGSSKELCEALAKTARRLASGPIDPHPILAFTASRLVALNKCPGVRPIGVGEVSRRIIGKAILSVISVDIQKVASTYQLCAGQKGGCEAAVHAMRSFFESEENEGLLFVDATNAFNTLNRETAMRNIQVLCPSLANVVLNTYRLPPSVYINGEAIVSKEGTTQGDPLAMSMYAIAVLPLILELENLAKQLWFADDAAAAGRLRTLKQWWDTLVERGPKYGYFVNPSKTWLVVKECHLESAKATFSGSGVHITTDGKRYLGSYVGPDDMKDSFLQAKVQSWILELEELTLVANSQPHAAFCAFTHGIVNKWRYLLRTTGQTEDSLQPLEDAIRHKFAPAVTGHSQFSENERQILSLPARMGGLSICIPKELAKEEYVNSVTATEPLVRAVSEQRREAMDECANEMTKIRNNIKNKKKKHIQERTEAIQDHASGNMKLAMDLAKETGASSWLSVLPID